MCFRFPPTSLANKYTECINRKQNPNTQKSQKKYQKNTNYKKKYHTHTNCRHNKGKYTKNQKKKIQNRCLKKRTKTYVYFKARKNTK